MKALITFFDWINANQTTAAGIGAFVLAVIYVAAEGIQGIVGVWKR